MTVGYLGLLYLVTMSRSDQENKVKKNNKWEGWKNKMISIANCKKSGACQNGYTVLLSVGCCL